MYFSMSDRITVLLFQRRDLIGLRIGSLARSGTRGRGEGRGEGGQGEKKRELSLFSSPTPLPPRPIPRERACSQGMT